MASLDLGWTDVVLWRGSVSSMKELTGCRSAVCAAIDVGTHAAPATHTGARRARSL